MSSNRRYTLSQLIGMPLGIGFWFFAMISIAKIYEFRFPHELFWPIDQMFPRWMTLFFYSTLGYLYVLFRHCSNRPPNDTFEWAFLDQGRIISGAALLGLILELSIALLQRYRLFDGFLWILILYTVAFSFCHFRCGVLFKNYVSK